MHIPLVDLKAQYQSIRAEVNAALQSVLDEACFILGPPVARLKKTSRRFAARRIVSASPAAPMRCS